MSKPSAITGVVWTDEEWQRVAREWALDVERAPDAPVSVRWPRVNAAALPDPARHRATPRGPLESKAARLLALIPAAQAAIAQERAAEAAAQAEAEAREAARQAQREAAAKVPKVFWNHRENAAFAKAFAELELSGEPLTIPELCARAQEIATERGELRADRHRRLQTVGTFNDQLLAAVEQARTEALEAQRRAIGAAAAAEAVAKEEAELSQLMQMVEGERDTLLAQVEALQAQLSEARAQIKPNGTDYLAQAFAVALTSALQQPAVSAALGSALAGMMTPKAPDSPKASAAPTPAAAPKVDAPAPSLDDEADDDAPQPVSHESALHLGRAVRPDAGLPKRKVLIIGLMGAQIETIRQQFGHQLALRFMDREEGAKRTLEIASGVDSVVAMERFSSSTVKKALREKASDYHLCSGTTSDLKRILHSMLHTAPPRSHAPGAVMRGNVH